MEYVIGLYLIGFVITKILLVVSVQNKPLKDFTFLGTIGMVLFTSTVWPVFTLYCLINKRDIREERRW